MKWVNIVGEVWKRLDTPEKDTYFGNERPGRVYDGDINCC